GVLRRRASGWDATRAVGGGAARGRRARVLVRAGIPREMAKNDGLTTRTAPRSAFPGALET
ncbi:hypothetical protein, partial [Enterorhabdus sp. P55]|uniref:hypothetical protein n=1 Tax=Enterorhabdus sp. P55 TaxID=2304571 RepID=UPI001F2B0D1B